MRDIYRDPPTPAWLAYRAAYKAAVEACEADGPWAEHKARKIRKEAAIAHALKCREAHMAEGGIDPYPKHIGPRGPLPDRHVGNITPAWWGRSVWR